MPVTIVKKSDGGKVTPIRRKIAEDTKKLIINDQLYYEDEFQGLYWSETNAKNVLLEPRYNPLTLYALVTRNNILSQCVSAMEVNVDGTGFSIAPIEDGKEKARKKKQQEKKQFEQGKPIKRVQSESQTETTRETSKETVRVRETINKLAPPFPKDEEQEENEESVEDEAEKRMLQGFFDLPYPDMSFVIIRRLLRVDLEATGNAYLEIIENVKGEIVFLRWVDCTRMRLVKLDKPVLVEKSVMRNGVEVKAYMHIRERRFAQKIGEDIIYYKEFGSKRQLNRLTGEWYDPENQDPDAPKQEPLKPEDQATSMIHFTLDREPKNNYGVPRWINQLPSILGSRKAEEFNLEFFDAGGIPPAVVFIQGGSLASDVSQQLQAIFNGSSRSKHRGAVVEVQSSTGSLESVGRVDVKTERFGGYRTNDAMFQKYDEVTEMHTRVAFRLPPIFLGKAEDYSFASAMTSYMVAEAQVFAPERNEFDEIINSKICRSLGAKKYKFVSNPITLKNVEIQLKGIELVQTMVKPEELVTTLNDITGLNLEYDEEAVQRNQEMQMQLLQAKRAPGDESGDTQPGQPKPGAGQRPPTTQKADPTGALELLQLAGDWAMALGLEPQSAEDDRTLDIREITQKIDGLRPDDREVFNRIFCMKTMDNSSLDVVGLGEIASCASCLIH